MNHRFSGQFKQEPERIQGKKTFQPISGFKDFT